LKKRTAAETFNSIFKKNAAMPYLATNLGDADRTWRRGFESAVPMLLEVA
jgi:hypothetical protein